MKKASTQLYLQNVRCSYVFVTEPNKDNYYSIQPLIPKGSKTHKELLKAQNQILIEAFGPKAPTKKAMYKLPIRDGDEERDSEEYVGMVFVNANSRKKKPGIVNRKNMPPTEEDMEDCFSGAYFHVHVTLYSFDSTDGGKPGIAVGLNNVMLRGGGDRLDGSVSAESAFADFAEDGDDLGDDFDDEVGF